jgi:hypothetical protein
MVERLNPFIDDANRRWFDPTSAVEQIGHGLSSDTLAKWAERGMTPFGLSIESIRVPYRMSTRYSEGCSYVPRRPRRSRPVISEETVKALRTVFDEVFRDKRRLNRAGKIRGDYTLEETARLREASKKAQSADISGFHLG